MMLLVVLGLITLLSLSLANDQLQATTVVCDTTKGQIAIDIYSDWAPLGAERFLHLVSIGFYTDIPFFRSVEGFLTQFGISDNPDFADWHGDTILDDPNIGLEIQKNYISFAGISRFVLFRFI